MLRRHAHPALLVSLEHAPDDAERLGQIILAETQCPAFAADSPADMLVNRRHDQLPAGYFFVNHTLIDPLSRIAPPAPEESIGLGTEIARMDRPVL
jgi:hypothetical protein